MVAFPLERFTTDPNILRYSEPLQRLYMRLLGEISSFSRIFKDFREFIEEDEDWFLKKIRTWGFRDPEILNGLFLKIYDVNMATLNWPPLSYPESAPLLVYVPGYHGESEIEWSMRILRKIGFDMHEGYTQNEPPPYTPDMSSPLNPFEKSWLSDPLIREAFDAIRYILVNPPPKYANRPVNNPRLVHGLLSGSSLRQNLGQDDNEIFTAYTRENTIHEDTICSPMSVPARFYARILGSSDFDTFYAKVEKRSKEFEALFASNSILPEKLTRKGLPWDQQLFTVIGPSIDPLHDTFHVLSRTQGGSASVPVSDTMWIKMETETYSSESSAGVCTIQGAFMSIFKPFLWLYYNGVHSVSPSLLEILKGVESDKDLLARRALQALIHPLGSLSAPFTLTGKRSSFIVPRPGETFHNVTYKTRSTNFSPLMSNLRRLRKSIKKRSWHFWNQGSAVAKIVNEFIERYGVDLTKNQEIRDAATALQKHHTTANKDALIQALKDAIRRYKATRAQLPLDTYTGMHDKPVANLGGTDYSVYDAGINDLEIEMAKPWYAKTWGKSSGIIKGLLETYLELFSDKGDLNVVNALLALKKLKSQDAIAALKKAIETRRYTVRGLPTPGVNSEGPFRRVALPQTIRDERARLDPMHEPVERRGRQPWEVNMHTVRIIPELPLELPKAAPISVRRTPAVRAVRAVRVTQKRSYMQPSMRITNFRPPKPAFTNVESDGLSPVVTKQTEPNTVTVQLPTSGDTIKVPLGQTGGFSPSIMASFVTNGMRLMPAAAYLGYKQIKSRRTTRRK